MRTPSPRVRAMRPKPILLLTIALVIAGNAVAETTNQIREANDQLAFLITSLACMSVPDDRQDGFQHAVGFGLFVLLALIQIQSTPFTKIEVAYFFGSIALAVINGTDISDYASSSW